MTAPVPRKLPHVPVGIRDKPQKRWSRRTGAWHFETFGRNDERPELIPPTFRPTGWQECAALGETSGPTSFCTPGRALQRPEIVDRRGKVRFRGSGLSKVTA